MSLLFMDGFDAGDYATKWAPAGSGQNVVTGRFGGKAVALASISSGLVKSFTASTQITFGVAFYQTVSGGSGLFVVSLYGDTGTTQHLTLSCDSGGLLKLYRGNTSGTLLATGTTTIPSTTWNYVEMQATIADSGGVVTVKLNGSSASEISFTGDTKNAGTNTTIDAIKIQSVTSTVVCYYDDFYLLNSTGTSNTTFLGDCRVSTLVPNGNGTYSQLTGSDGDQVNNYALVNTLPIGSATYTQSGTTGQRDTYAMGDLLGGTTSVFGVQNNIYAKKSDATTGNAKSALYISGGLYYGATRTLSTSYTTYSDIYNANPATSTGWTISDVNGLESGMEVA